MSVHHSRGEPPWRAAWWLLILGPWVFTACGSQSDDKDLGKADVQPKAESRTAPQSPLRFRDVTEEAGLASFLPQTGSSGRRYMVETLGSGLGWLDYDGDGFLDLYLVNGAALPGAELSPPPRNRLFRNRGDGTFEDVTDKAGAAGHTGYGQGCAIADYDGDGDPDIYVANFGPNALLENLGDGTFRDVTEESGTGDAQWGSSAAFFDADRDGDLDLYVVNYVDYTLEAHQECFQPARGEMFPIYCPPSKYGPTSGVFYRNLGEGRFRDESVEAGLYHPRGKGLGVVATDFDLDGDLDLYVANDTEPNFLFRNDGGRFTEIGQSSGTAYSDAGQPQSGMGVDAGDVDGDGRFDLIVTNYQEETNTLYGNGPDGMFSDRTYQSRLTNASLDWLGFGTILFDADDDRDLDLFVANGHVLDNIAVIRPGIAFEQSNQLFENDGQGRFREVPLDLSFRGVSRGVASADFDHDGDLDLVVSNNRNRIELLRNDTEPKGHWISLELVGTQSPRDAIGARVIAEMGGRSVTVEWRGGGSYLSSSSPRLHVGCGDSEQIDRLTVHWPSGHEDLFEKVAVDHCLRIEEGAPGLEVRW
ncbi:MAG: CRTAC1 family protein [Planctomycetota bacterium]